MLGDVHAWVPCNIVTCIGTMPYSVMHMHWYHAILQCALVQCHSVIYIGIAIVCDIHRYHAIM